MERCNIRFSQIDSVYPLSGNEELYYGVPLRVQIYWDVRTWLPLTGSRNQRDFPKIELMKRACGTTVETAERYDININIEVHGYFTTNPEFLERILNFVKSPKLGLNLDTGNSFIARQNPVQFCQRFNFQSSPCSFKRRFRKLI